MTPEMATTLLCQVAEDRDERAFQLLFDDYAPRIKYYMMQQGAEAATADDIAQEALTTVWRKAHMFDPSKGNAPAWIYRVARNLRIDRIRRERVWQPLPDDHREEASNDPTPDEELSQNEVQTAVREAIETLPVEQREIIELCYMGGLSQSEAAERLEIPVGTVKSRMRLAYGKLQPILASAR